MVVPEALAKLGIGDRSEEVNPNLAELGWNEAWENDEWWADSPKPSLNLQQPFPPAAAGGLIGAD